MSMSVAVKLCAATDERGKQVYLVEHQSRCELANTDDRAATRSLMLGPDNERLLPDGAWFLGVHSGKRYKRDS